SKEGRSGFILYFVTPSAPIISGGVILFPTEMPLKSQGVSAREGVARKRTPTSNAAMCFMTFSASEHGRKAALAPQPNCSQLFYGSRQASPLLTAGATEKPSPPRAAGTKCQIH